MTIEPPDQPAGPFEPIECFNESTKSELIESIRLAPSRLRAAVAGLSETQLDTLYKNWTLRQITHHIADSHLHSIIRFKWALTEDHPTIKAYEEGDWAQLSDAKSSGIEPSLLLLDGLHTKWVQILESMTPEQYLRTFHHPQTDKTVTLWMALNNYAWHGQHHTEQIVWLRGQRGL